jgi:GNAT acetyltransferase-like protein
LIGVEQLARSEEASWDSFLLGVDGGLLYHSLQYRDLLVDHLDCEPEYLVAKEDGEIKGVLPMMWARDGDARLSNSLPFYGSHGGPVAVSPEAEDALLQAWNERATDSETAAATLVGNPFLAHQLAEPRHVLTDDRISQVTSLPDEPGERAILELIDSSARRNVRKAQRVGYEVGVDNEALSALWRIYTDNMRAIGGLAKSEEFFAAIPRHFQVGEDFNVWVARLGEDVAAALLVLYFNGVAEYFTPAVDHDHRSDQPLALILLKAMSDAVTRGLRLWNWGGTWLTQEGVLRFKRKWGAREGRYRYYVQINDERLLSSTPEELRERFPHFYVAPFSELKGATT